jgi:hypothetical protein
VKAISNWKKLWTVKDDSMLMLGIYRHGLAMAGCWEKIQADPDLGFKDKFFLTGGTGDLPSAVHLYRRARTVLKVLVIEDEERYQARKKKKKALKKAQEKDSKGRKRERESSGGRDTKSAGINESDDDFESIPIAKIRESKKVKKESAGPSRRVSEVKPEEVRLSSGASTPTGSHREKLAPVIESLRRIKAAVLPGDMGVFKKSLVEVGDRIEEFEGGEGVWEWVVRKYWPNKGIQGEAVRKMYESLKRARGDGKDEGGE